MKSWLKTQLYNIVRVFIDKEHGSSGTSCKDQREENENKGMII